jgi:hypothetical protein
MLLFVLTLKGGGAMREDKADFLELYEQGRTGGVRR